MNIGSFGDSIAWGASDYEKGGWVERLKTYCLDKGDYSHVYNLGVCGETTVDVLKRFANEASVRKLDVIVFAIGINDSKYIQTTEKPFVRFEDFKSNLVELLNLARQITDKIVFVGLTCVDASRTMPVEWDSTIYFDNERIGQYDSAIKDFCEKENLPFVDMSDAVDIKKSEDGVHPDASGHEEMFKRVVKVIDQL